MLTARLAPEDGGSSCKAYDMSGSVLHCSSFSNTLSPEFRVGWMSAGRFHDRVLSIKFLSNMSSYWIVQQTVAEFLKHENLDRHLRTVRMVLAERMKAGLRALDKWDHLLLDRSRPQSGFMVWMKLQDSIDTLSLFATAAAKGLSFVPGALFSVGNVSSSEMALNFGCPWTPDTVNALDCLMSLIEAETRPSGFQPLVSGHR